MLGLCGEAKIFLFPTTYVQGPAALSGMILGGITQVLSVLLGTVLLRIQISYRKAPVHDFIRTGSWVLPSINSQHQHEFPTFTACLNSFGFPGFDLAREDCMLWDGVLASKVSSRIIWDCIRPEAVWCLWRQLWSPDLATRYAHLNWLVCHGRLNTLDRLASFGMVVPIHCFLCADGLETSLSIFSFPACTPVSFCKICS